MTGPIGPTGPTGRGLLAECCLVAAGVGALRLLTLAPDAGGVSPDTGNYLLALQGIDLALGRPHLPGSWLLIVILRGLAGWFGPHGAMLAFTVVGAAVGAGLAHALWRRWFTPADARLLSAVLATQPLVWFYGTVAEVYTLDLLLATLVAVVGLARRGLPWLAIVLAVGAALRLTTPLLLLPLYGWLWHRALAEGRCSTRAFWWAHAGAAPLAVAGLWPLVAGAGGPAAYLDLLRGGFVVEWSLVRNVWGLTLFAATLLAGLGVLWAAGVARRPPVGERLDAATRRLLWAWLLLPAAFFFLGHYQKGYALLIVVPLLTLAAAGVAPRVRRPLLAALAVGQAVYFLGMPYRAPALDVLAAPSVRQLGLVEVWWQRARSTHLMALAMPRALARADAEMATILATAPASTIVVDPTVPLPLRGLQVCHPDHAFAVLEVHRADGWRRHAGLDEETGEGVAALLEAAVLVTRTDFARRHLDDLEAVTVCTTAQFTALRVAGASAAEAARRYAVMFAR